MAELRAASATDGTTHAKAAPDPPAQRTHGAPFAWLLLTSTSLMWSANAIFAKLAVGQVSPLLLVALRWVVVVAVLLPFARRPLANDWARLRPHIGRIAALGATGYTLFNVLFYVAAHYTTAVNLGITQAVMPIFIFVLAFIRFRTPVSPLQIIGVIAAMTGVLLVVAQGSWQRLVAVEFNGGDLLCIVAVLLYAIYTVALRSRPVVSPLAFFAVLALSACAASLPFALGEWLAGDLLWPTQFGWALIAGIALLPSLFGQIFFIRGVEIIGPARAGLFVNLTPVFAATLAVVCLGESFHWYHAVALMLVFTGIWASERGGRSH